MDRRITTLVLALGIVLLGGEDSRAQQQGDIEGVEAANRAFYRAASARDMVQMEAIWAHAPYVRAIHPGRPTQEGWEAVRTGWQDLFGLFTEISVSMPQPHVRVGSDTA